MPRRHQSFRVALASVVALLAGVVPAVTATALPSTGSAPWAIDPVRSDLTAPTSFAFLPDGRVLVTEKGGTILLLSADGLSKVEYGSLTGVTSSGERGLLDLVPHPGFDGVSERRLFALATLRVSGSDRHRILQLTHVENSGGQSSRLDPAAPVELWVGDPRTDCCNVGGGLTTDGTHLFFTTGDDLVPARSQDLSSTHGKIHRIGFDGSIPADNPTFAGALPSPTSVWARGLRHPDHATWDTLDDRLLVAEVGGGRHADAWESVLEGASGADYGSPDCGDGPTGRDADGSCSNPLFTDPFITYPHAGAAAAVSSGTRYTGSVYPEELQGAYFFADATRGWIRYSTFGPDGAPIRGEDGRPVVADDFVSVSDGDAVSDIVDLAEGPDGALWFLQSPDSSASGDQCSPTPGDGCLQRIVYGVNSDPPPAIRTVTASPSASPTAQPVDFAVTASDVDTARTDTTGALTYLWDFGDGATSTAANPSHSYATEGPFDATVTVSDGTSETTRSVRVEIGVEPSVDITSPSDGTLFVAGQTITVEASGTDSSGALDPSAYAWTVELTHESHAHPVQTQTGGASITFPTNATGHDSSGATGYRVQVTVTGGNGLTSSDSIALAPDEVALTLDTVPAGLLVDIDGIARDTALPYDSVKGFSHTLSTREFQCSGGRAHKFLRWDSGATSVERAITVPVTDTTYTATFTDFGPCPIAHYRADDVLAVGGDVLALRDVSGNENDLFVAVDGDVSPIAAAPALVTDGVNGHDYVAFDGIDDGLGRGRLDGGPSGDAERTIIQFVRYRGPGTGGFGWGDSKDTGTRDNRYFALGVGDCTAASPPAVCTETPGLRSPLTVQAFGPEDTVSDLEGDGAGWIVHTATVERTTSGGVQNTVRQYRNGVEVQSEVKPAPFDTRNARTRLGMEFTDAPAPNDFIALDIAEVIVFDSRLSPSDRSDYEDFLRNRYLEVDTTSPTIADQDFAVPTAVGEGSSVGTVVATDDQGIDRFEETGGSGTEIFDVSRPGRIVVTDPAALAANGAAEYTLTIAVHDVAGNSTSATMTIDAVEPPPLPAGLVLRLETALDNGPASDGAPWFDRSPSVNDVAVTGGNPRLGLAPSGAPSVVFDGVGDAYGNASTTSLPTGDDDRTLFTVVRYGTPGPGGVSFGGTTGNPANKQFGLGVDGAGFLTVLAQGAANDRPSTATGTGSGWLVHGVIHSSIGDTVHHRNGTVVDTFEHDFDTAGSRLTVGADLSGTPQVAMDVAAVLVWDRALAAGEVAAVNAYLLDTYLDPPTVGDDVATVALGSSSTLRVLDNDEDVDGLDASSVVIQTVPGAGSATANANGTVTYSAALTGTHSFTYTVRDNDGVESAPATVTVTVPTPAASGSEIGGAGADYYLTTALRGGAADITFTYGRTNDRVLVGDWDGDGIDTLAVRRGNVFHIKNRLGSGPADHAIGYGRGGDVVYVGDWDGDGIDTLAVRRGNRFYVKNSISTGSADVVIAYGRTGDIVLVGDWDGDGIDTLAVRRGNRFYVKNSISTGSADVVIAYGRTGDIVLVGDWDGDGDDTLAVRRGRRYFIKNVVASGVADLVFSYGHAGDAVFAGDWDDDGDDTLGVRRE